MNVEFTDVWTNPALAMPSPDFSYLYTDLVTPAPTWRCPRCGEEIDGRVAACWQCDTEIHEPALAEPTGAAVSRDYALLGERARPVLRWLVLIGALAAVLYLFVVLTGGV
jgi:hypothetical protein